MKARTLVLASAFVVIAAAIGLILRLRDDGDRQNEDDATADHDVATLRAPAVRRLDSPVPTMAVARIEGVVVDEQRVPVGHARILWRDAPYGSNDYVVPRVVDADDKGRFEIEGSGRYMLHATSGKRASKGVLYDTSEPEPLILQVRNVGDVEVTVVRDLDDEPIANALVRGPIAEMRTDVRGIARLPGIPTGGIVQVSAHGYADGEGYFQDDSSRLVVGLRPGVTFTGVVLSPSGPVANARVTGTPEVGLWPPRETLSDASGRWRMTVPQGGRYAFSVVARGWIASGTQEVDTVHGADIVLRVKRGLELSGTVVTTDGAPVGGTRVTAYAPEQVPEETITNADGEFLLYTQRAPRWDVVAKTDSGMAIGVGGIGITMVMKPWAHTVRGVVVDDANAPIRDARVSVSQDNGAVLSHFEISAQARTDEQGEFEVPFQSGKYFVLITDGNGGNASARGTAPSSTMHRFVITRETTIEGRVLFEGQPLADYHVVDDGSVEGGSPQDRTERVRDANGRFSITLRGTAGRKLAIASSRSLPRTIVVAMEPGGRVDAGTIELEPAEQITGRVVRENRGVRGARVWISGGNSARTTRFYRTDTDDEGAFSISSPPDLIKALILVHHPRFGGTNVRLDGRREIVVELDDRVPGTVVGNSPLGATSLAFVPPSRSYDSQMATMSDSGRYGISLLPGVYDAVATTEWTTEDDIVVVTPVLLKRVTVRSREIVNLDLDR